jgi:hypothetical protein
MYNPVQAMFMICTKNANKSAAAVHNFLSSRGANILSETSTKHGDVFVLNIMLECELPDLLEIGASCEAALARHAHRSKPQIVPVAGLSRYAGGFIGRIECHVLDAVGRASTLTQAINPHADVYQMVCYTTEEPMNGSPLFVGCVKVHIPDEESRVALEGELHDLDAAGWTTSISVTAVAMVATNTNPPAQRRVA